MLSDVYVGVAEKLIIHYLQQQTLIARVNGALVM